MWVTGGEGGEKPGVEGQEGGGEVEMEGLELTGGEGGEGGGVLVGGDEDEDDEGIWGCGDVLASEKWEGCVE